MALDPAKGTEIRKTRPAVIVSNDSCNAFGTRVVVLPVTSNVSSLFPGEAHIDLSERTSLSQYHILLCVHRHERILQILHSVV